MSKTIEQWLLFEYVGGEFTPLSKPFKTGTGGKGVARNTPSVNVK
jgi:hypothetical protein